MKFTLVSIERRDSIDDNPDISHFDETATANYYAKEFHCIGIQARAETQFVNPFGGTIAGPYVESPGLWGIASDSGEAYFAETFANEQEQLLDMLRAMNCDLGDYAPIPNQRLLIEANFPIIHHDRYEAAKQVDDLLQGLRWPDGSEVEFNVDYGNIINITKYCQACDRPYDLDESSEDETGWCPECAEPFDQGEAEGQS